MLYDAGVDAFTAQKLLGHAHIETTLAVYTHLSQRKKDESIQKLTAYVKNGYTTKQSKKSAKNKEIARLLSTIAQRTENTVFLSAF